MSFINFWALPLYRLARPFLFRMDPEDAHYFALNLLKKGRGPKAHDVDDPVLRTTVCGLNFSNPIGLAAGFDKQGEVISAVLDFGFGFVELGTITPLPQTGNPRPRLFRAAKAQAVINRFGFNSDGFDSCLRRISVWHDSTTQNRLDATWGDAKAHNRRGLVGINIGKNKESLDAATDYVRGIEAFAPYSAYITVNISSPNTPGLRDLQGREQLAELLKQVMAAREATPKKPAVFVKIAPDQTEQQEEDIAEVVLTSGVDGMIIGNTTLSRPASLPANFSRESGGLSGKPVFDISTRVLASMYRRTRGKIPIIGCGGVFTGADAYAKIRAGASLVQIYTALVFEGPGLVPRIKRDLAALLKRDGFKSVSEAVGADSEKN